MPRYSTMVYDEWKKLIDDAPVAIQKCKCCNLSMQLINGVWVCNCGCIFDGWEWKINGHVIG